MKNRQTEFFPPMEERTADELIVKLKMYIRLSGVKLFDSEKNRLRYRYKKKTPAGDLSPANVL
jgi:hypothetical protein